MQGTLVQSLVEELRAHRPCGMAKRRMYLEFWSNNAAPWGKMQQKEDIPFRAGHWKHGGFQSKINMPLWTCNMNINTFQLMFWNISILISPEYSLEGLILKLKLQYFGHLMQRANSLEKTLMLWKIEGRRRRGWQRMRWLDSVTDSMDMNLSRLPEIVESREAWRAAVHGVAKSWTQLSDWTPPPPPND